MDEYGGEGQLGEVVGDQDSYLNEISAVLRTAEHVWYTVEVCARVCAQLCAPALKTH